MGSQAERTHSNVAAGGPREVADYGVGGTTFSCR